MDIIGFFIAADGIHIGIKAFAGAKTIFMQREAFPFCKRMYDFCILAVHFSDVKGNRTFHTV